MRIGGLQKYSLVDFPPRISCVVFTAGCNFHCPYCHNPQLSAPGENTADLAAEYIMSFLRQRKKYLDAVVISGGEPTLHRDLPDLCEEIKSMGFELKIDTNGSNPEMIKQLIKKGLADYIAMDVKTTPENYESQITANADPDSIRETVRVILDSKAAHEFRTTCVKPFTEEACIYSIAELIRGADLHAIQRPHTENVLTPEFFQGTNRLYSEEELNRFRSIIAGFVRQAVIR
ncbi:MAG: anaerobic ribonucleoside-triphosphate reductase activating protein [Desulfobacterales bacterium]|nr:anaerobic ribonucleoside-triphosphate reductase activating protein [Desulfobacterales bacterium]